MNTNKLKPIVAALGMGLALASGSAAAGVTWHSPLTTFEDDNLDFVYIDAGADGILSVGDVLVTTFEVHSTSGLTSGPSPIFPDELTGVAAIQVSAIIDKDGDGQVDDVELAPYSGGLNEILALGGVAGSLPGALGIPGGPALVAMYLDSTPNYESTGATSCLTGLAECIADATDGSLFQVDGFGGDLDNYMYTLNSGGISYAAIKAGGPASTFAAIDFGLDTLFRGLGHVPTDETVPCSPVAILLGQCTGNQLVFMQGQGTILGGAGLPGGPILGGPVATRGAFGRSDFDYTKQTVPEPELLVMLSMGLLAAGFLQRRRSA
jgi:hypothetical protein